MKKLDFKCLEDVIVVADRKNVKRGAFEIRIFLEKVISSN